MAMTKKDFEFLATTIAKISNVGDRERVAAAVSEHAENSNSRFDKGKFYQAIAAQVGLRHARAA